METISHIVFELGIKSGTVLFKALSLYTIHTIQSPGSYFLTIYKESKEIVRNVC